MYKLLKFRNQVYRLIQKDWKTRYGIIPLSQKQKKQLIQEKGKCELCGKKKNLEVHHKPFNRVFYSPLEYAKWHANSKNLLVVCPSCHAKIDPSRAKYLGDQL